MLRRTSDAKTWQGSGRQTRIERLRRARVTCAGGCAPLSPPCSGRAELASDSEPADSGRGGKRKGVDTNRAVVYTSVASCNKENAI